MSPGATCAMEAAVRWQLLLERVRNAAGMPMADVWNVGGVITCLQSQDALALGMSMSSTAVNKRWPCKFCLKEPLDTVWYIGDDDATCPFNTATRICHECYLEPYCDGCGKQIQLPNHWRSDDHTWCKECKAEAEWILAEDEDHTEMSGKNKENKKEKRRLYAANLRTWLLQILYTVALRHHFYRFS